MKASHITSLVAILCLTICSQVLIADIVNPSAVKVINSVSERGALEPDLITVGLFFVGWTRPKRQASIDTWTLCENHLQQCQNFLNVPPTNDSAANLKAGCNASVESFRCLRDALSKCPLPATSKTNMTRMNTTLSLIIKGFSAHCRNKRVHADYNDTHNLACLEKTKVPTELCTSLYIEKLFAMTGEESILQFCCERLEFVKCIANNADNNGCVDTARRTLVSHASAMFMELMHARGKFICYNVTYDKCLAQLPQNNHYIIDPADITPFPLFVR